MSREKKFNFVKGVSLYLDLTRSGLSVIICKIKTYMKIDLARSLERNKKIRSRKEEAKLGKM